MAGDGSVMGRFGKDDVSVASGVLRGIGPVREAKVKLGTARSS
jgi:hypothetical protein